MDDKADSKIETKITCPVCGVLDCINEEAVEQGLEDPVFVHDDRFHPKNIFFVIDQVIH